MTRTTRDTTRRIQMIPKYNLWDRILVVCRVVENYNSCRRVRSGPPSRSRYVERCSQRKTRRYSRSSSHFSTPPKPGLPP